MPRNPSEAKTLLRHRKVRAKLSPELIHRTTWARSKILSRSTPTLISWIRIALTRVRHASRWGSACLKLEPSLSAQMAVLSGNRLNGLPRHALIQGKYKHLTKSSRPSAVPKIPKSLSVYMCWLPTRWDFLWVTISTRNES